MPSTRCCLRDGRHRKIPRGERRRADFPHRRAVPKGGAPEHTVSFAPVTAKFFRVAFKTHPASHPFASMDAGDPASLGINFRQPPTDYEIAELVLHPGARVNRFEEKAAFIPMPDLYQFATPTVDPAGRNPEVRRHRPDFQAARRRYSRLDPPRRQLGRPSLRLLPAGNHQPSGHRRRPRAWKWTS